MAKLIHPELSYAVRGVMLHVYNALGPMLPELYYERAIAFGLEKRQIQVVSQKGFEVFYEGCRVGLYFPDLWVEDGKLLLELKVAPEIENMHKAQAISYLKVTGADLAIVANFGAESLQDVRLPNYVSGTEQVIKWASRSKQEAWLFPELSEVICKVCYKVHALLGTGFLHQVYRRAAMVELRANDIGFAYVKRLPVWYDGISLGMHDTRLIVVEEKVALAVFALREGEETAVIRLRTLMKQLGLRLGFLANFYGTTLRMTPVRIEETTAN